MVTIAQVFGCIGVVVTACGVSAAAVHRYDKDQLARVQREAAAEIARVEGDHQVKELMWQKEVDSLKREVLLSYSQDHEPFRKAKDEKRKKGGRTEEEEKKDNL